MVDPIAARCVPRLHDGLGVAQLHALFPTDLRHAPGLGSSIPILFEDFFMKYLSTGKAAMMAGAAAFALCLAPVCAQDATTLQLALKDHHFVPAELSAPANQRLVLEVTNQDPTPAEFESKQLRIEKLVAGGAKITVQVRALAPGRYRFFDDYHEKTTEGFLVVK
jgi:hypothetical protein